MKIKTYQRKVELIEIESFEIPIPSKIIYLFETGTRRSIRIEPIFTTCPKTDNNTEELHKLVVTCVSQCYENKIEKFTMFGSFIENIWNTDKETNEKSILRMLIHNCGKKRTKEEFEEDLNSAINSIKNIDRF